MDFVRQRPYSCIASIHQTALDHDLLADEHHPLLTAPLGRLTPTLWACTPAPYSNHKKFAVCQDETGMPICRRQQRELPIDPSQHRADC